MKTVEKTFRTPLNILKISLFLIATISAVTFTSCGDDLKEDLDQIFSTTYTFFSENPDENSESIQVSKNYEIGESLNTYTLPSEKTSGFQNIRSGYKINGWIYYNNPLTLSTELPENITMATDENGNESGTVGEILVTSAPAAFYVNEWNPITYYIIFDGNGGSFTNDEGTFTETEPYTFTYDTAGTLESNPFTRNGYIFNGWLTNNLSNYTTPDYQDGQEILNLTTNDGETIRLYALWLLEKIKISFDPGEGSGTMDAIENVTLGDSLPTCTFAAPEEGKTFTYWAWSNSDGSRYITFSDEEQLTELNYPNEDATLTACWDWIPCTVNFISNDTTISTAFAWGQEQALPSISELEAINSDIAKTGYNFTGWNTKEDGSGTSYEAGASFSTTNEATLYAQWTPQEITITFDGNGSTSGTMSSMTVKYDELPATLSSNSFSNNGFIFNGWGLNANGEQNFSDAYTITTDDWESLTYPETTLYALWRPRGTISVNRDELEVTCTFTETGITFTAGKTMDQYQWSLNYSDGNSCTFDYDSHESGEYTLTCIGASSDWSEIKFFIVTITIE